MSKWRLIETAPKDGTSVIIAQKCMGRWQVLEAYHDRSRRKCPWLRINTTRDDEWFDEFSPSHWMPLPKPPSRLRAAAQGVGR